MGVNHGRLDILVSQKGLDFTDVDAVHEEMGGKAVAQCMDRGMLQQFSVNRGKILRYLVTAQARET